MKKFKLDSFVNKNVEAMGTRTAKVGGYSFLLTLIVLGILIAVNVLFSALPTTMTQYDMSAVQLYSLTSNSKVVVNNLTDDVTIYWITQNGEEDSIIEKLLNVYDDMSDHVTVVKKNPDIYPTFVEQYTDEDVANNSLIVVSGDKSRYISYSDIYESDMSDYYSSGSVSYSFDGEGLITSAINYVVSDDLPKIYVLGGHGEAEIPSTFTSAIQRANMETEEFTLLNVDDIPEDADAILIYSPTSDLSEEEVDMLEDYVSGGGHLMVFSGPAQETELTNLKSILTKYGVETTEGIVIEGNRDNYAFQAPYVLMPTIESDDITDPIIEEGSYVIAPVSQGLTITSEGENYAKSLLDTSEDAFSKTAGYNLNTYEKEDGDIDGPFSLAVSITDSSADGKIIWVASDVFLDDNYNSYSAGANDDFAMNAMNWMIGQEDSISIRSKSMDYNYLTINASQATLIKVCMIAIIPLFYLFYGIDEVVRRRKMQ